MNIVLIRPEQFISKSANQESAEIELKLDARQSRHCTEILKLKPGDSLQVGLLNQKLGVARCKSVDTGHNIKIALNPDHLNKQPPRASHIHLYLALPRPKMLRRILRTVAECGIKQLTIFNSAKVEKSYWQTPSLEPDQIEQYFIEGLEQARDTVMPALTIEKRFRPFIEDRLGPLLKHNEQTGWVAHPYNTDIDLATVKARLFESSQSKQSLQLLIGPEGGFTEFEIELLQANQSRAFYASDRVFRTETFVSWVLGALES